MTRYLVSNAWRKLFSEQKLYFPYHSKTPNLTLFLSRINGLYHTHRRTSSCLRLKFLKNRIRSSDLIAWLGSVSLCLFYVDKFLISFYNITMNYLCNLPEIFAALTECCSTSDFCGFFYTISPPKTWSVHKILIKDPLFDHSKTSFHISVLLLTLHL